MAGEWAMITIGVLVMIVFGVLSLTFIVALTVSIFVLWKEAIEVIGEFFHGR